MHEVEFGIYDGAENCFIRDIWSVDDAEKLRKGWNKYTTIREIPEDDRGNATREDFPEL